MAYKDFVNDFKKGITGDVLFFYGAEDYLMEWAAGQLTDKFVDPEWRSLDVKYMDGSTVTAYEIMGEARAYSMFSEKRIVIVRNYLPLYRKSADPGSDELLKFAASSNDTSVLIFMLESSHSGDMTAFGKKLIKACHSYEFARLDKADLKSFISKRLHAGEKMITRRDMDLLIDISGYYNKESGYDLTRLNADLAKMIKASDGEAVTSDVIEDLLIGDNDRFAFNLVDAVVSGNRSKALEIAETIIREEDGAIPVTELLIKQFEIMNDALELEREGYSIAQMAKMTGVNEFRFKRAYQAASSYSRDRIRRLLIQLYNIDRDMKRGDIDKDVALELFSVTAAGR